MPVMTGEQAIPLLRQVKPDIATLPYGLDAKTEVPVKAIRFLGEPDGSRW